MFRTKTVVVVGAGASKELRFPLGSELMALVQTLLRDNSGMSPRTYILHAVQRILKSEFGLNSSISQLQLTAERLAQTLDLAYSIDSAIDTHRDDPAAVLLGKLAIGHVIQTAEDGSALSTTAIFKDVNAEAANKSWLGKFWKVLHQGVSKSNVDTIFENLTFICFNYDRCIEQFLFTALIGHYWLDKEHAARLISSLQVIHPYGSLGYLPWQNSNQAKLAFGAAPSDHSYFASQLRTYTEQHTDPALQNAIHREVGGAETIIFLGSAYHNQNLDILRSDGTRNAVIFGSSLGISEFDLEAVKTKLSRRNFGHPLQMHLVPREANKIFEEFSNHLSLR